MALKTTLIQARNSRIRGTIWVIIIFQSSIMMYVTFVLSLAAVFFFASQPADAASYSAEPIVPCKDFVHNCWPTGFTVGPHGNIYYVQRFTGQVRVYNPDTETDKRYLTIRGISTEGEQGLLGIALHPDWPDKKWLYLFYTKADPLRNQVVLVKERSDGSFDKDVLFTTPAGTHHLGGTIHIGPDRKLYVVTGENYDPELAQDLTSRAGKILRVNLDGSIPDDNPFGNRIFSYGRRNSFGFIFDPLDLDTTTLEVWQTENGPECNDELNYVESGKNYGWGVNQDCPDTNNTGDDPVAGAYTWEIPHAVTGATFCVDCGLADKVEGNLLVGAFNNGVIYLAQLNQARDGISNVSKLYDHGEGSYTTGILAVEQDADGSILFSDPYGIYKLVKD